MIFKSVDDQIKALGYSKIEENRYLVYYKKTETIPYKYTHIVCITHKSDGPNLILSYEPVLPEDPNDATDRAVGLTYEETVIFGKKFREMNRKWRKIWRNQS